MGADSVQELILGLPPITRLIGQQHGRAAQLEQTIGHQLGAVVAEVRAAAQHLLAAHHGVAIAVRLQQIARQVHGNEPGAAPHAAQAHAGHVAAHLVAVDHHRRQGGRGVEQAAVHHQNLHVLGGHARLREQLVQGREHGGRGLLARRLYGAVHGLRALRLAPHVRAVAHAGALDDLALEVERFARVLARGGRHGQKLLPRDGVGGVGLVAREVHEVDAPGPREEVDGEAEDEGGGGEQEGHEVALLELRPQVVERGGGVAQARQFDRGEREERDEQHADHDVGGDRVD